MGLGSSSRRRRPRLRVVLRVLTTDDRGWIVVRCVAVVVVVRCIGAAVVEDGKERRRHLKITWLRARRDLCGGGGERRGITVSYSTCVFLISLRVESANGNWQLGSSGFYTLLSDCMLNHTHSRRRSVQSSKTETRRCMEIRSRGIPWIVYLYEYEYHSCRISTRQTRIFRMNRI